MLFPETKVLTSTMLWIANMQTDIKETDKVALLDGLKLIYEAKTAEEMKLAVDSFTARWKDAYPEVAERIGGENIEELFTETEALRKAGFDVAEMMESVSKLMELMETPGLYTDEETALKAVDGGVRELFPDYGTWTNRINKLKWAAVSR